jgi:hypothetical protein
MVLQQWFHCNKIQWARLMDFPPYRNCTHEYLQAFIVNGIFKPTMSGF